MFFGFFPIWIPVIFYVVVAECFDAGAGSQKKRDNAGGGMSRATKETPGRHKLFPLIPLIPFASFAAFRG
jgi:hypothetical protein